MAARAGMSTRGAVAATAFATVLALLTGCGAPSWNYVTNKDERTYAKVPVGWQDVSGALPPSSKVFGFPVESLVWIRAFDAAGDPTIDHVTGDAAPGAPTMVVLVFNVPPQMRGMVNLDLLRDAIYPVSEQGRMRMAMQPLSPLTDFKLYGEQMLMPGNGMRGVRSVYSYVVVEGPPQVFDLTAYTNDDASKLYLISIRCSLDCYKQNDAQINDVATSFTVRETP